MDKFCVFCGDSPQEKNKEHVLPKWLIEMTGDPKRMGTFGIDFHKKDFPLRQFSFDSLVFPACSVCNERFARLEDLIKPRLARLLSYEPAAACDFILLLDWLDKIRVGLWLGYMYLDKNLVGIDPSFHIDSRLGRSDRMVAVIKVRDAGVGLSFTGPEFKGYQLSPTCVGLRVNGLYLVNASGISLCSQRLGFPYMEPVRIRDDHKLEAAPMFGSERVMNPVERTAPLPRAVALYQPIFRAFCECEGGDKFLQSNWLRDRTAHSELGYGKPFLQKHNSIGLYPDEQSLDWVPSDYWHVRETFGLPRYVCDRIYRDYRKGISIACSKELRKHMRKESVMTSRVDYAMLQMSDLFLRQQDANNPR